MHLDTSHIAVFPGTFDPATKGHLDLIVRGSQLFSHLIVAVANSPSKNTMFTLEQRVKMLTTQIEHMSLPNVAVKGFFGMMPEFLQAQRATVLLRGVRSILDCDYELQLTGMYKMVMPKLQIVMLPSDPQLSCISSTMVRDIIRHHGDPSSFVPSEIGKLIQQINPHSGT